MRLRLKALADGLLSRGATQQINRPVDLKLDTVGLLNDFPDAVRVAGGQFA